MILLFLSLSDKGLGHDGIGCSQGQGVGGIPLALNLIALDLALYEAGLTNSQDMFDNVGHSPINFQLESLELGRGHSLGPRHTTHGGFLEMEAHHMWL